MQTHYALGLVVHLARACRGRCSSSRGSGSDWWWDDGRWAMRRTRHVGRTPRWRIMLDLPTLVCRRRFRVVPWVAERITDLLPLIIGRWLACWLMLLQVAVPGASEGRLWNVLPSGPQRLHLLGQYPHRATQVACCWHPTGSPTTERVCACSLSPLVSSPSRYRRYNDIVLIDRQRRRACSCRSAHRLAWRRHPA